MQARQQVLDAPFEPSSAIGHTLDRAMRVRLADSLEHVVGAIGAELALSPQMSAQAIGAIRARRQSPQVFGAYYDLVLAVEGDQVELARTFASQLIDAVDRERPAQWVARLSDRPPADEDRHSRLLLPEDLPASDPDAVTFDRAAKRIDAAMNLLDRGFPEMADEIRALLYEIVIAVGPTDPKSLTFDGSSSYMLWGAIMLNARGQESVLDTAQTLAHESGHNRLFGLCTNGPLIENDDDEVYAHPLRQDPRPMDGVVHAAYVTARMHQTVERLLDSAVLDEEQRAAAERDLDLHRRNFLASDDVIRSAALLTPVGKSAMAAARAQIAVPA